MAPTGEALMAALGYGARTTVERPSQGAYHLNPTNLVMMGETPILRRLRPLVRTAEKLGVPVTHLAVGSLSRLPPDRIYRAIVADPRHPESYPQAFGEQVLLDALAQNLTGMTGVRITSEDSMITPGGIGAVFGAINLVTRPGDLVTVFRPSWPNTPVICKLLGRSVQAITTDPSEGFRVTPSLLRRVKQESRLVVIERPGNPTAKNWDDDELGAVRDFLLDPQRRETCVLADEEYYGVSDGLPRSILELGLSRTISTAAWSKTACITSARLGRLTTLDRRIRQLLVPWSNLWLGVNNFMNVQHALAVLVNDFGPEGLPAYFWALNQEMADNRRIAREVLGYVSGLRLISGQGAYYDVVVFEDPQLDEVQLLLHRLLASIAAARDGERNGDLPKFTYCIPLSGFQDIENGQVIRGLRVTHSKQGDQLRAALQVLVDMIRDYREAGYPHYGGIEEVTGKVLAGVAVEPMQASRSTSITTFPAVAQA
ncbi:MAG: hypothetical protein A3G08_02715 [Candidatus Magasanikbacteria bacterium RIFCSPLOWO2_12_FULL_47_9b]|nr:MAG: hypothetical protein A3I74_00230 [Candidatus Magasanikbacteria bacterium RIFCSPLOWO2_02_FULL_47_16]OGH80119.1 MAG: hypothetical protein A3C10_03000 [Candidatus Magasanikbacteria bacterium RIFCSPHIGHO2_02_FULL_48_18]OGH83198.1 MAG: hypothetical protein A3G08_02715 [Candidatus Magasanikbacteria bacterium RIFCSPLOWO2_12_FULL_47_9b]